MCLGNPFWTVGGEVHQLVSRGKQLLAVTGGRLVVVGNSDCQLVPQVDPEVPANGSRGPKVRCVCSSFDRLLLGCQNETSELAGGRLSPFGRNSAECWQDWDLRRIAQFDPEGYCNADRLLTVAMATRCQGKRNETILARFVRKDQSWLQLGSRSLFDFKARALVGYQFPDEDSNSGRIPIMVGEYGAYGVFTPNSEPEPIGNGKAQDFRDAVVWNDGGMDRLYAVGQAGFFVFAPEDKDSWIRERDSAFCSLLVVPATSNRQACVVAAGNRELVCDDGSCTKTVALWSRPIIPTALAWHKKRLVIAYQIKGQPGITHVSNYEGDLSG